MERLEKMREQMKHYEIDGMLITSPSNRKYMTQFTGTAGVALLSGTEAKFITDFRYIEQANEQAKAYEIVQHTGPIDEEIAKQIKNMGIKKLGFEQDHLTYSQYATFTKKFDVELIPISGLIEKLRLIKDASEIKILKEAAQIADAAFTHITSYIRAGLKEIDVANELEFFMRKKGAISSSFDIIVASGIRSALPHGVASNKVINKGELVTLDFGAYYKGYCSDITRTIAVGEPNEELRKIYETVQEAQAIGMNSIKPGLTGRQADALTRDFITEKGYGQYFGHSTGHGIGLEVHEGPALSMKSDTVLEPGMVVTVEPGIYISGIGGTRIEDDTLITESGNESLTHSSKELLIVGD
ncbi:M24 family metallopeptidase [Anaerobacillus sp. MEB173]|uniref:M24 family metallopeptidase n=1 Tax=Anaerobacillus sp. MEB173 TaxID=3383345 RepID=UPI003F908678